MCSAHNQGLFPNIEFSGVDSPLFKHREQRLYHGLDFCISLKGSIKVRKLQIGRMRWTTLGFKEFPAKRKIYVVTIAFMVLVPRTTININTSELRETICSSSRLGFLPQ